MRAEEFFAYARERHSTYLRRAAGLPRSSWTSDPILQKYRFCNIFRELDRTTIWFREHVRDELRDEPDVLLATVLFRWFNRISTGQAIFCQSGIESQDGETKIATAWDCRLGSKAKNWMPVLDRAIRQFCGSGPYVTGSYIIKTPNGMSKLDGVLWCVEQFLLREDPLREGGGGSWLENAEAMQELRETDMPVRMELVWSWLRQFPYMGDFMAYEVITDLRHTALLDRAPDIMTWANPGPGAQRGLARIHGRPLSSLVSKEQACAEMMELLALSQRPHYWPQFERLRHDSVMGSFPPSMTIADNLDFLEEQMWPAWEMREVEHTLCEFDKYERARTGEGRPRQVFR